MIDVHQKSAAPGPNMRPPVSTTGSAPPAPGGPRTSAGTPGATIRPRLADEPSSAAPSLPGVRHLDTSPGPF